SEQLASFATDFESKILRPVREKRAAGDEILAIQPVSLGVSTAWEGVVDGEVCGLGPLADSIRVFLHWVPIKLDTSEALRLCVSCGDALAREGEFTCARKFYAFVSNACDGIKRERVVLPAASSAGKGVSPPTVLTNLKQDEACWAARAEFGAASTELRVTLTRDPHVQFSATLTKAVAHLRSIQSGMRLLLNLPKKEHDAVSWLVLEGSVLLFDWCEPLSVLGHGDEVAEFLVWSILAMESMVSLSTVKHLPWRTRLAAASCYALEDAGKPEAAAKCADHAIEKVSELRRQEGMDPPIPPNVLGALDAAEGDLKLLTFKYAAVAAAVAKRPQPPAEPGEGGGGGGGGDADGTEGNEPKKGLSEDDLRELLEQHISDANKRPVALLELLGGGTQPSSSAAGCSARSLTSREASAACKCAVSLLLPPTAEKEEGVEGEGVAGEGEAGGGDGGLDQKDAGGGSGFLVFPLDIDQEMQLMREMYQLGEFQVWEAMLPSTVQRLREASQTSTLSLDDSRAFWFELSLWSSCKRLQTWRDKPEPPQPAAKGGLKRTPPTTANNSTDSQPASNGESAPPLSPAANVVDRNSDGGHAATSGAGEMGGTERGGSAGKKVAVAVVLTVVEGEDELRDSLLATRQAEMVEIPLEGEGPTGSRVNLTPMLTVVGLLRKALFGRYRHVLERRGEALLEAAMSLWEPYVASILRALDSMPGKAEVDLSLLDALLLSLETISACLSALNADDEPLRATVALRLAILQADFRGDRRKACQASTLRTALGSIDKHRQSLVSHHLQHAPVTDSTASSSTNNHTDNRTRMRVALAKASITTSFYDSHECDDGAGRAGATPGGIGAAADMAFHELAALQLDITNTLFRVELQMGRDIASQLAKHQKAEAAAQLAARNNASKRKRSSNKTSKVTFGDSKGSDTLAGQLVEGWVPVILPDVRSGGSGSGDVGATKALTGTNAIVCAAGGGPLLTKAVAVIEAAKESGMSLGLTTFSTAEGIGSNERDAKVESCPATEGRLASEFRRNPYGKAMLLATMARFRTNREEQEGLIAEAAALQASSTEKKLLGMLTPPREAEEDNGTPTLTKAGAGASAGSQQHLVDNPSNKRGKTNFASPPPPLLFSRSHSSIELLPLLFYPSHSNNGFGDGGRKRVVETALVASNATSTTTATAVSQQSRRQTRNSPRIAKVCVYGKPEGAGTGVTLSNTHFSGLGIPIPFDESTGVCGAVTIRGLTPNESYVFAIAAFDENGDIIGEGIGNACQPIETLNPLPLPLCWAHLSRTALGLGCSSLAAQAATEVYRELMASDTVASKTRGGRANGRPRVVGRTKTNAGKLEVTGGITTNLRDGWMASPLLGQALHPEALDRCPRGVLQAFVQACFLLVDTSDEDAMARAKAGGGGPLDEQVGCLVGLKRLSLACEAAVLLQDWDLVARGVWRAYHLLLPLLRVSAMGRLLFQACNQISARTYFAGVMCHLHQCLSLVPRGDGGWDAATKTAFACLAYQITIKGHEIGEYKAAQATLLDHGLASGSTASAEAVVFKEPDRSLGNGVEKEGDKGDVADGKAGEGRQDDTPAQVTLLEMWMGLHGYGRKKKQAAVGEDSPAISEGGPALSKLRKALNIRDPVGGVSQSAEDKGHENEQAAPIALDPALEVVSVAHQDPAKALELLRGETFVSHPDRARLLCRVCWIALDRGMAKQVVSWLGPTAVSDVAVDGTEKSVGEGTSGHPYLLAECDLKPLVAKVLALEGALEELPYISPSPKASETVVQSEEGGTAADTGGSAGKSDEKATGEATAATGKDGDDGATEGGLDNATTGSSSGQSNDSRGGGEREDGNMVASAAEAVQLLGLAEVEHILGAACLQLGIAAAAGGARRAAQKASNIPASSPLATDEMAAAAAAGTVTPFDAAGKMASPIEASRPTVAETVVAAAGWRRPWGFGNGPFSEVSATKADIFVEGGCGGPGDDGGGVDERDIVAQLEDTGMPWSSVSAITTAATTCNDKKSVEGDESAAEADRGNDGENFSVLFSRALLHLTKAASRARWGRSWVKTERSCGLLWNAILSLWLSPQDFRPPEAAKDMGGGCGWDLPLGEHHGRIYAKACEALLDAVDATHCGGSGGGGGGGGSRGGCGSSDGGSNAESVNDNMSRHQDGGKLKRGENSIRSSDQPAPPDTRWVSRFVEWGLQGILRCRCWGVVVNVGSKLLSSTGGLHGGHRVYPVVLFAQKRLCSLASTLLSTRESRLAEMDEQFQKAQEKRRRRKVLKALETKSKEEIEHERARQPLVEAVGDARVRKQIHDHRLGKLLQSRDNYAKTKKIGRRTLDDARESLVKHLALLSPPPPPPPTLRPAKVAVETEPTEPSASPELSDDVPDNGTHGVDDPGAMEIVDRDAIAKSQKEVLKLYGRAVDVLRDKRERELLAEALCDVGDLHVLTGNYDSAARSWTDAIDSICSALDSTMHWREVFKSLRTAHPSSGGPPGGGGSLALALGGWSCLAGGTVLGKLSIFTRQTDMRGQLNLCLMAAEMIRAPLETSLPFPQRECDFASFTPETLGGPGLDGLGLWVDERRLSASALSLSLMHVQGVLAAAGRSKEAFAVQAILEHIASKVTLNPLQLVRVKLARAECLAEAGFPAEAASALAGVLSGKSTPKTTGGFAGRSRDDSAMDTSSPPAAAETSDGGKGKGKDKGKGKGGGKDKGAKGKGGAKTAVAAAAAAETSVSNGGGNNGGGNDPRDMAKSGLPFYGFAPYHNDLSLGHPANAAAVSWLIGDCPATDDSAEDPATADATASDGKPAFHSRHTRLFKRGLVGVDPNLKELHGENETCLIARTRARLLLILANCSAMLSSEGESSEQEEREGEGGNDGVLRRVRDAADCILGEILQVVLKRISPAAIPTQTPQPDTSRSGKSAGTQASGVSASADSMNTGKKDAAAAAAAEYIAATAPDEADGWAPPMAADALLMRGRLALLDGKLRVCRHHASRGLAILLRHGLGGKRGDPYPTSAASASTDLAYRLNAGRGAVSSSGSTGGVAQGVAECGEGGGQGLSRVTLGDEQRQPWRVVQTWLELRHDLAAVALLQASWC
ncbi:unnamed protein product, partial [Pylaiella littoralis]